ncbi:MAG TPA: cytochrome ubiquinol oxidase subunit I, partial [Candidatus Dormibacteraeota bacterium]
MLGLQITTPDFPGIGNNVSVGIAFLVHILIAEFSLGAITLAVAAEWHHVRTGDERTMRYARSLANAYYLIFSLGATFAVFAVVLLTGLWANQFGQLVNKFLPLVAFAFLLFLVLAPLLVWYRNTFASMEARKHAVLGTAVFALQTLFMVLIVGIDAYLINPVHAGLTEPAFNPVYWPLLVHRLIGNVSWAALFCAAYAALKLRGSRGEPPERAFQSWAARVNLRIGLLTGLLMPVVGFLLVEVIKQSEPGYFENLLSGGTAAFMV